MHHEGFLDKISFGEDSEIGINSLAQGWTIAFHMLVYVRKCVCICVCVCVYFPYTLSKHFSHIIKCLDDITGTEPTLGLYRFQKIMNSNSSFPKSDQIWGVLSRNRALQGSLSCVNEACFVGSLLACSACFLSPTP